jgi:hypothetical protein
MSEPTLQIQIDVSKTMVGVRPLTSRERFAMPAFGLALLLLQTSMLFAPRPASGRAMATMALVAYAVFAAAIGWFERGRAAQKGTFGV